MVNSPVFFVMGALDPRGSLLFQPGYSGASRNDPPVMLSRSVWLKSRFFARQPFGSGPLPGKRLPLHERLRL